MESKGATGPRTQKVDQGESTALLPKSGIPRPSHWQVHHHPIYLGTFTKLLSKWSYHDHFGASSFGGSSSFSPQHLLPSVSFLSLFMSYSLPWTASSKKASLKKRLTFRSINLLPEGDPWWVIMSCPLIHYSNLHHCGGWFWKKMAPKWVALLAGDAVIGCHCWRKCVTTGGKL